MEYYNHKGIISCYISDKGRVYKWEGDPVAVVYGDKIHHPKGQFIGWFRYGYLIDLQGHFCLFTNGADTNHGPPPPDRKPKGPRGERKPFPALSPREAAPSFPRLVRAWGPDPFAPPPRPLWQRLLGR